MLVLFACAIFCGAGLLFLVQPMIARQVLPLLGGSPAVWNTCMVFFQVSLLGGYLYAHLLTRLSRGRMLLVHGVLLLVATLTLPIGLGAGSAPDPEGSPALWLLGGLSTSVGAPFFFLATASPLLQAWFANSGHRRAEDPYFLYVASNAGSLLALLGYPLVVGPLLTTSEQLVSWSFAFGGFALLAAACAFAGTRSPLAAADLAVAAPAAEPIPRQRRLTWIALAFVPSSLMLGATQHISTDVASTPVLWVVPLALYLLTFIVAFSRVAKWTTPVADFLVPVAVVAIGGLMLAEITDPIEPQVAMHLLVLLIVGLSCHGRLAADRPGAGRLTEFYLMLSAGGALGGIFNALLAPLLFDTIAEYPIVLLLACMLRTWRRQPSGAGRRPPPIALRVVDVVAGIALVLGLFHYRHQITSALSFDDTVFGFDTDELMLGMIPALGCLLMLPRRWPFLVSLATALFVCAELVRSEDSDILLTERTFFGVLTVTEQKSGSGHWHFIVHGTTQHGCQYSLEPWSKYATTYYTKTGPAGDLMAVLMENDDPQHIALVGLGAGTLASYGRFDWRMTYFEIDPAVVQIATNPGLFTYCSDSQAKIDFAVGDARLRIGSSKDRYDAIFLDAFSSDAIPIHLLTRDAAQLYLERLKPGGFLAFHVTNRHLDLFPVVANIAADLGLHAMIREDDAVSDDEARLVVKSESDWIVLARTTEVLGDLTGNDNWRVLPPDRTRRTWTDDYSNIFDILK